MAIYLIIAAVFILVVLEVFWVVRKKRQFGEDEKAFVLREWAKIVSRGEGGDKQAVIDADKLLDYVLRRKGYTGSLADKLRKAEKLFTRPSLSEASKKIMKPKVESIYEKLWGAHRMRNKIVHEVGFEPSEKQVEAILCAFANAFRDLGVNVKC